MNEPTKKFTADLLGKFGEAMARKEAADIVSKTKADDSAVGFRVVISTSDEDRQGDELDQSKWKLDNFRANPVVLWAHDYGDLPIGICTSIGVEDGRLVAEGKFAPAELNPFAGQIAGLYEAGFVKTTSVGYIEHEDETLELLEFSFVPVPANPYALSMREMKRMNLDLQQLVMKGISITAKGPQAGDDCELEDGTPGVLQEDDDSPGRLICIPRGDDNGDKANKSNETQSDMDNELVKALAEEHDRHGTEVGKAVDEFAETCMKSEKAAEGTDNSEVAKAIEEFKDGIDGENDTHLEKCMKAIDDSYETMGRKPNAEQKSIDEFKAMMKGEHLDHVKCFDKAIEEFKSAFPNDGEGDGKKKAIDEFTKSIGTELDRHEKAHMDMCKAEAERMGEGESDGKAIDEAGAKAADEAKEKAGRAISAANAEKINGIIKAIQDHHDSFVAEHQRHTDSAIASLKELMGSPQEDEGKKPDEKSAEPPKQRSSTSGAAPSKKTSGSEDLEAYLLAQRLVRQVKTASENALRQLNEGLGKSRKK